MTRSYDQILSHAFKTNSLRFAWRTALPTLRSCITKFALPPGDKPALCTMNILPPMMTVWYHFAKKNIADGADIVIFDCTGTLDHREFPDAHVLPFLNFYASTKGNIFIRSIARHRRIAWICDDDMFLMSNECLPILKREFAVPGTASVSFRPREWWAFDMNLSATSLPPQGERPSEGSDKKSVLIQPSSSYCLALDRDIFMHEKLSLSPAPHNPHPATTTRPPRRYDTFDKANEILLKKGYRCAILSPEERQKCVAEFSGLSGAVMLLHFFRTPQQTLDYFRSAPPKNWQGNLLFGLMNAMLSVCTMGICTRN